MMINKDDRRDDSYLSLSYTSLLRLDDNNVMMNEMAVGLILRKFTYITNASICSFTAANIGGSNGSI